MTHLVYYRPHVCCPTVTSAFRLSLRSTSLATLLTHPQWRYMRSSQIPPGGLFHPGCGHRVRPVQHYRPPLGEKEIRIIFYTCVKLMWPSQTLRGFLVVVRDRKDPTWDAKSVKGISSFSSPGVNSDMAWEPDDLERAVCTKMLKVSYYLKKWEAPTFQPARNQSPGHSWLKSLLTNTQ